MRVFYHVFEELDAFSDQHLYMGAYESLADALAVAAGRKAPVGTEHHASVWRAWECGSELAPPPVPRDELLIVNTRQVKVYREVRRLRPQKCGRCQRRWLGMSWRAVDDDGEDLAICGSCAGALALCRGCRRFIVGEARTGGDGQKSCRTCYAREVADEQGS